MVHYVRQHLPNFLVLAIATAAVISGLLASASSTSAPPAVSPKAFSDAVPPAPIDTDAGNVVSYRPASVLPATADRLGAPPPAELVYTFIWPANGAISGGMTSRHPRGIDIAAELGDPVVVVRGGEVMFAGGDVCCVYGLYVIVQHDNGWSSLYAHLGSLSVELGDRVEQGDVLGPAGSTGKADGVHLHFELLQFGAPVNPLGLLQPLRSYTPISEPIQTLGAAGEPEPTPEQTIKEPEPISASAGEAIDSARRWMSQQGETGYQVDHGSCFAIAFGPNWSVSCTVSPWACEAVECRSLLESCVIASLLLVEATCSGY